MYRAAQIGYGLDEQIIAQIGPGAAAAAATLREAGFDAVFVKVHEPALVHALRSAGLAVYASQPVFLATDDIWTRFPASRPVTADGQLAPEEGWYRPARPTDANVRGLRLAQIRARLIQLPLDGLWLDFIRWPARWEIAAPALYHSSFDPETLAQFAEETGIELPSLTPAAAEWILDQVADIWWTWRSLQIARFVAEVADIRTAVRPQTTLGLFTVPWTGTALDGLSMHDAAQRIVGQDPALLGRYADVLSPMVYHRLCGRAPDWPGQVTSWFANRVEAAVWPVIERLPGDDTYTRDEYARVRAACQGAGGGPVIVFNLAGVFQKRD